ncbi:diaminopimelate epimerase [candidate division KSB3 bacterium]|uniref:Diaminopimelate epimerase n=1 Tax=candidate division KSB3 bacterium TaxID=2044937 RepID=A0A2G6E346_9BACT|nr:MAG: diaminopimelate epimerase [candidate division KSB3 bacterium]PIE29300.1 MAG: diaminopimelate epimerase [candidate division KSB3 bacterium]
MKFVKYHGLGNDYIVINPADLERNLDEQAIKAICHRNYGPGSDGILLGPFESKTCDFRLRILNPDGSEAEKSGNGLRIFSRYLWDQKLVGTEAFSIETLGGQVKSHVFADGKMATVDMGHVSFKSSDIPVKGPLREVLNESLDVDGLTLSFCAATIGNPHCVVLCDTISAQDACKWGPFIETDSRFPNKTNVQFMKIQDRKNIQIEIWERGAGYTLASGSSSSAAAAVANKLGFCDSEISVHMPGGTLQISIHDNFFITMTGPVAKVYEGTVDNEVFEQSLI